MDCFGLTEAAKKNSGPTSMTKKELGRVGGRGGEGVR